MAKTKLKIEDLREAKGIVKGRDFYKFLSIIAKIRNDSTLFFNENEIVCYEFDYANVCMFRKVLPLFSNFTGFKMGFDIHLFKKKIRDAGLKYTQDWKFYFGKDINTPFVLLKDSDNNYAKVMSLTMDYAEPKMSWYNKPLAKFRIPVKVFDDALSKTYKKRNERQWVDIVIKNNRVSFSGDRIVHLGKEHRAKSNKDCKSRYQKEYLEKHVFEEGEIIVELGDNYPIKMEDKSGNLYIVAPRTT